MRKFKFLLSIIIVTVGGYMVYQFVQNNVTDKKIDYQVQSAQTKITNIDSDDTDSKESVNSDSNVSNDDFSVLVKSPLYNAVVSLDDSSKEFNVKLLDDVTDSDKDSASHYINLSEADIDYLIENKDTLIEQFKNSGLFDKYNMITSMLKTYDTNINEGDLIELALNFLNK